MLSFLLLDINECIDNNGGCVQSCIDTIGSFSCGCNSGFTLRGNNFCDDIDECVLETDNCEQTCTNTVGSYNCSCSYGFTFNGTFCRGMPHK